MNQLNYLKIKLSTAITIAFIIILIISISILSIIHFSKKNNSNASTQEPVQEHSYYQPTEKELLRSKELASILHNNFPTIDGPTSTIPLEYEIRSTLTKNSKNTLDSSIVHSTAYGSFNNLINGDCDIIFSTELSKAQYNIAKSKNIELEITPILYEGLVFVVNASNPVDTLTQEQIRDIYSGKITNWKDLGGNDEEIVAYQRPETSSSQIYMKNFMGNAKLIDPITHFIPSSTIGLVDCISTYDNSENAIGYSVYAYPDNMYGNGNEIKFIKVDGIEPNKLTMTSKQYPLLNYNYAIYNKNISTNSDKLVEWLLTYDGQIAISNAGYISLKDIYVEEPTISSYTQKGSAKEERLDFYPDYYKYVVSDNNVIKSNKLIGLKNKQLQDSINTFITNSISKLEPKQDELNSYLNTLNSSVNSNLYKNTGINTSFECINGYLSIIVSLNYEYRLQSGIIYSYDGYSKIFDLYTGKEIQFNDLFFNNTDFVPFINTQIENQILPVSNNLPEKKLKRPFYGLPTSNVLYGLTTISFTKDNPYFVEGESFNLNIFYNNISLLYKSRDMKNLWDDSIKISKELNSITSFDNIVSLEKNDIIYNIYYANTNNLEIDSKINNYINEYIKTKADFESITKFMDNHSAEYFLYLDKLILTVQTSTIGNEIAKVSVKLGPTCVFDELIIDLKTGKLLQITFEDWCTSKDF